MTAFRDAIAKQIETDWEIEAEIVQPYNDAPYEVVAIIAHPDEVGDSVLAMPEMEAIRKALWQLNRYGGPGYLDYLDLPESVVAWVLGGAE